MEIGCTNMMFNERKKIVKPIIDYIQSGQCSLENLLGLRASLQAVIVAIDRRLNIMAKQRHLVKTKLKTDELEETWLD